MKDTKKGLLQRQRSRSVKELSNRPLEAITESNKKAKAYPKVAPQPHLDRLEAQPAVQIQNTKEVSTHKQQLLGVNSKLRNLTIFQKNKRVNLMKTSNDNKRVDDNASSMNFSERIMGTSLNKSFNPKGPIRRFATIRSNRDNLNMMSKYEQELSSNYNDFD